MARDSTEALPRPSVYVGVSDGPVFRLYLTKLLLGVVPVLRHRFRTTHPRIEEPSI